MRPTMRRTSSGSVRPSRDGRRPVRCRSALDRSARSTAQDHRGYLRATCRSHRLGRRSVLGRRVDTRRPGRLSLRRRSGSAGTLRDRNLRLGTGHRLDLGRPRPAGEVDPSKFGPCNSFETMKSRMMDHGSERRKVGSHGGVFHCYIAAYSHERPRRGRKPSVEGHAGPWEASRVRRCYTTFSVDGKGLTGGEPPDKAPKSKRKEDPKLTPRYMP